MRFGHHSNQANSCFHSHQIWLKIFCKWKFFSKTMLDKLVVLSNLEIELNWVIIQGFKKISSATSLVNREAAPHNANAFGKYIQQSNIFMTITINYLSVLVLHQPEVLGLYTWLNIYWRRPVDISSKESMGLSHAKSDWKFQKDQIKQLQLRKCFLNTFWESRKAYLRTKNLTTQYWIWWTAKMSFLSISHSSNIWILIYVCYKIVSRTDTLLNYK